MPLTLLVFLGSIRDSTPPRPARLGLRVARACVARLAADGHEAVLIDPLDIDLPGPFKLHFAYAKGKAPESLEDLARKIDAADGYVMVSPEYNHSMSPALAHLLNHFGSSLYSYKPSAIVTYSAGQDEDGPAERIEPEHLLHRQREPVYPLAEVYRPRRH